MNSIDKTRQDNVAQERKNCQVVVLGQMDNTMDHTFESANRVYDKNCLCPTIPTCAGGGIQPKVIQETKCVGGLAEKKSNGGTQYFQQDRVYSGDVALALPAQIPEGSYKYIVAMKENGRQLEPKTTVKKDCIEIKQATKEGSIKCKVGGCYDGSYPDSKTRRGRVQNDGDVTPTITAQGGENINYVETIYRIRKLTPKECWRLMGYTDEDFEKAASVNSNTQLYKQAGNAIIKQVLMAIFSKML